ncbi:hypothetical protein ACF07B_07050 [Streptomyces sp. NPDC015532]|uniref:hypothetical protein n=1 Tax=Streptomyces sp. NPDC015532 TaxID=3364960 RepID=UPI0036FBD2C0
MAKTIALANIKPLEPYTNNSGRMECICLNEGCPRQGRPVKVLIKAVRRGAMACKYCARRAIDPDEAVATMRERGQVEPSALYVRVDDPWLGICLRCQRSVHPRLHDVMQGQGACLHCAPDTPLSKKQAWQRALVYRFRPSDPEGFQSTTSPGRGPV